MPSRIIMHVDMDAFFAAVEIRERPELKGKSVIVGASPKEGKGRGIVNTASYEARKFGIYSGMPVSHAYKLCPDGIFIEPDFKLIERVSESIMEILQQHADRFEHGGIDEAYMDVGARCGGFSEAKSLAYLLKEKIFESEKLTCSIGIGPNKLVAKVASDFRKPDGLTVVELADVKKFLFPLPVSSLLGVGSKTGRHLAEMGIRTVGDLAGYDIDGLIREFGQFGIYYHQAAHGMDDSDVSDDRVQKSFSREHTFEKDVDDKDRIFDTVSELAEQVHRDMSSYNPKFRFRKISIKVRYRTFETHTSEKTLIEPADSVLVIKRNARDMMRYFIMRDKIRLVGVRVSHLDEPPESSRMLDSLVRNP